MIKLNSLETINSILEKARKRVNDADYEGEYGDDAEGSYSDPTDATDDSDEYKDLSNVGEDDDKNDAADQWLNQQSKGDRSNEETSSENEKDVGENDGEMPEAEESASQGDQVKGQAKEKIKDIDPERLAAIKQVSGHWLNHADQVKKMRADARANPHLFAEGHRIAAHNTAHEDFNTSHQAFKNSDDYKNMSSVQKMRAEVKFKKDWQDKNPDSALNAATAVAGAHQMHGKAQDLHDKEMNARKAHILAGGQGGGNDIKTFSSEEAAQHAGGSKDQDGGYQTSIVKDPAAAFASRFQDQLKGVTAPKTQESEEQESLASPERKIIKHPSLSDPHNQKLLNDFVTDYHPLIMKNAHKARKKAMDMGISEDKLDIGDLQAAGMHGLIQAAHDYHPESGSSFKAHANGKIGGLMQSHVGSLDYAPKDMRAQMKAREKGIISTPPVEAPASAPVASPTPAPEAPKTSAKDVIASSGHPGAADMADRHNRVSAQKVIIRKKAGDQ